ncbi:toxic anion resistance protein [Paenibacillus sp. LMG 31458]|uniref:Toxic anion resistance protein n=1 Tax=Paenibacillus phytorum TaxID=2654977 RepID=A0ABX1XY31_9BACL|nr:toxic anion resistance protein [Paenibacillus phytorum]NOU72713.1 toxic anion resistance protein [Paenibacillus phytorum]
MSFTLEIANPEEIKAVIEHEIKPVPEEIAKLKELADSNVATIMSMELDSLDKRREILQSIDTFGVDTMKLSSSKNALLQVSVGNLSKAGEDGGQVAKGLADLHTQIKDLDPSLVDFAKIGILGKFFSPIRSYFLKYEKADGIIADIIVSLDKGKSTLKNDNTTLEFEQQSLRELSKKLRKEIQLGTLMDESIELQIEAAKIRNEDPEKIRFIIEEILFPLRQRVMDLQEMLVVNQQGIMAMELVIRNNRQMMRVVDRSKTVTISALKISVMVASALYNQNIALKKVELLNQVTSNIITATSRMLKEQGAEIHKKSIESNISVDTLKQAFTDVISALDSISTYKQEALPKMRETINEFRNLADIGEKQILHLKKGSQLSI